ncbi:unnamed protein product, partial [Discosporangium mesarthrocarpum]
HQGFSATQGQGSMPDPRESKEKFVKSNPSYGYGQSRRACRFHCRIDDIREVDFPHLYSSSTATHPDGNKEGRGLIYLDHAGATLFGESQLREATGTLLASVHGNPHSQAKHRKTGRLLTGPVSSVTAASIDAARLSILRHFGAHPREWSVVFTSGATAALKLVGEQFPWSSDGGIFAHSAASHNSVLGIREYAIAEGARVICVPSDDHTPLYPEQEPEADGVVEGGEDDALPVPKGPTSRACGMEVDKGSVGDAWSLNRDWGPLTKGKEQGGRAVDCLYAFPAECNATGFRPSLTLAGLVKRQGLSLGEEARDEGRRAGGRRMRKEKRRWWVLLDAAKYAGTAPLDLGAVEADFVVVSFYKIFGYPTGLGALLVRDKAAAILQKRYFGGGTVLAALASSPFRELRPEPDRRLTDGTEHFLGVVSLEAGFRALRGVGGMEAIAGHTGALARHLQRRLASLKHGSGDPVCRFYGRWGAGRWGAGSPWVGTGVKAGAGAGGETGVGGVTDGEHGRGSRGGAAGNPPEAPGDCRGGGGQGPVVAFSVLGPGGGHVGHAEVEKLASLEGIQLRTGCFCNPGACQAALGLSDDEVRENLER